MPPNASATAADPLAPVHSSAQTSTAPRTASSDSLREEQAAQPSSLRQAQPAPHAGMPSPPAQIGRVGRYLALSLLALALAQYLAGFLFLVSLRLPPSKANPLTLLQYAYYYGHRPTLWGRILLCSAIGIGLCALCVGVAVLPQPRPLHGAARFATRREIRNAGLLGEYGIILGRLGRRYLMLAGQQGVALAAPPRAGKGAGIVIPNALNWPGSLVCLDIKRENWTLTAGFRAHCGQACYLFDPFNERGCTARWNPFTYVSPDPRRRINDLQRIAEMLYPDPPNVDPFWTTSARSLFLGIALYLFETPAVPKTIGEVLRHGMASDNEGFGHHWKRIIEGRSSGRYPLSPECVRALCDVIDLAPVTASSIRKTFTSRLDLWLNPILDAATAANDFDLRQLRAQPMSIYVAVNPDDLHRLRPVLNLFFQQAIGLQTRSLPEHDPTLRYQVMLLLDEFAAIGRMPIVAEAISYLPGYNVRLVLVFHTPAQLREVYGLHNAETMLKSLAARIVFAPKDFPDAREISDELGFTTVKVKSLSEPRLDLFNPRGRRSRSQTVSDQRRALLLPQEVKELGTEEALVFYEGLRPIRCRKIRYFRDKCLHARVLPPPSNPAPQWQPTPATRPPGEDVIEGGRGAAQQLARTQMPPASNTRMDHEARDDWAVAEPHKTTPAQAGEVADPQPQSHRTHSEPPDPQSSSATRSPEPADLEHLESLTWEDFGLDLSKVHLPKHQGPLSNEELHQAVESFLDTLREP